MMDPITLALTFLLKNPSAAAEGVSSFNQPGTVNIEKMKSNIADFSKQALLCYHRSARFRQADILSQRWDRQFEYGATASVVIRVTFQGWGGLNTYQMDIAAMRKDNQIRTHVIGENTLIPYNKKCQLEDWSSAP